MNLIFSLMYLNTLITFKMVMSCYVFSGDPEILLQTVWLNNGVYFGMRGRQDHVNLLWGDIELKTAPDGREYLEFTGNL